MMEQLITALQDWYGITRDEAQAIATKMHQSGITDEELAIVTGLLEQAIAGTPLSETEQALFDIVDTDTLASIEALGAPEPPRREKLRPQFDAFLENLAEEDFAALLDQMQQSGLTAEQFEDELFNTTLNRFSNSGRADEEFTEFLGGNIAVESQELSAKSRLEADRTASALENLQQEIVKNARRNAALQFVRDSGLPIEEIDDALAFVESRIAEIALAGGDLDSGSPEALQLLQNTMQEGFDEFRLRETGIQEFEEGVTGIDATAAQQEQALAALGGRADRGRPEDLADVRLATQGVPTGDGPPGLPPEPGGVAPEVKPGEGFGGTGILVPGGTQTAAALQQFETGLTPEQAALQSRTSQGFIDPGSFDDILAGQNAGFAQFIANQQVMLTEEFQSQEAKKQEELKERIAGQKSAAERAGITTFSGTPFQAGDLAPSTFAEFLKTRQPGLKENFQLRRGSRAKAGTRVRFT